MPVRTSFPLHHACTACGGGCHGVRVRLLPEEEEGVRARAAELGVPDAVEDGRLRLVDGRCALLDGNLCAIHARFGAAAKPSVCRQYPLVVLQTESERRVGVDPGCYTAWSTRDAAPLSTDGALTNRVTVDAAAARQELALLALLATPGLGVLDALAAVGVGPGFEARWFAALRAAPLEALLARSDTGSAVRAALTGPVAALRALDAPPPLALAPAEEAWAVDVASRMVALRLCASFPFVPGVALLALGGALLCAWADPRPAPFGTALAGWSRAMRAPIWWSSIVPGPDAMLGLFGRPSARV